MLAAQLLNSSFPTIHLYDRVSMALQLMEEYDIQHLAVVNEEKYVGIIGKSDLLDVSETNTIATTQEFIIPVSVKGEEHFLVALKLMVEKELSLLAVVNEQTELIGIIAITDLMQQLSRFLGTEEKGGLIVLEIARRNFSFGEICRLVETNDALITQCNTMTEPDTGLIIVTLKLNKIEISAIVATFQRYDYTVRYYFGQESYDNELKDNYQHLLAYLNV